MKHLVLLAALVSASGCLVGTYSQKGERQSFDPVDRNVSDGARTLEHDSRSAKLTFQRRTCIDFKSTYSREFYEQRAYPAPLINAITMPVAALGLLTGLISQDPGFFWPESRPAITPISFIIGGIAAAGFGLAGLFPMFLDAHKPRSTFLRAERTTDFDEIETECSSTTLNVSGPLPYKAWIYDAPVKGMTPASGVLDVRQAAITALGSHEFSPADLRHWQKDSEVYVTYELAGAPKKIELLDLYELRIYADLLIPRCSETCGGGTHGKRCKRREEICMEEGKAEGIGFSELYELCQDMTKSCFEKENPDSSAFKTCFDRCVHQQLPEVFKKN